MRFIQTLLDKLVCLILLFVGAWLVAWFATPHLKAEVDRLASDSGSEQTVVYPAAVHDGAREMVALMARLDDSQRNLWLGIGGVLAFIGLVTFLPRFPKRVARMLRLSSEQGTTTVDLKPIEKRLTQIARALPEVVDVDLAVRLTKDKKRIAIAMDVVLLKEGPSSAKSMSEKLKRAMMASAANVIGSDLVTDVEVHVRDVRLSKSADIIDIASFPALAADEPANYLSHANEQWSQREASEPSYLDGTDVSRTEKSGQSGGQGYQPPAPPTPAPSQSSAPIPDETEEEPVKDEGESPFRMPSADREPMDTIDSIIMVDEEDADSIVGKPLFDRDDEDDAKKDENRGY